jgi:hypothetical protein
VTLGCGWKRLLGAAMIVAVLATVTGCSSSKASGGDSATVRLTAADGGTVSSGGVTVNIPAGALSADTSVRISGSLSLDGKEELAGFTLASDVAATPTTSQGSGSPAAAKGHAPFRVELGNATLTKPAQMTVQVDDSVPKDLAAGDVFAVALDEASRQWVPVESAYDPATRTVTVTTDHFSIWSVVWDRVTAALAAVATSILPGTFLPAQPPTCAQPPAGVKAIVTGGAEGALAYCVDAAPGGSPAPSVLLRVKNFREFAVDVVGQDGATVTVLDPASVSDKVVSWLNAASGVRGKLLEPGGEADIVTPVSPGGSAVAGAAYDTEAFLASGLDLGVSELAFIYGDQGAKSAVDQALKGATDGSSGLACLNGIAEIATPASLGQLVSHDTIKSATGAIYGCLGQLLQQGQLTGLRQFGDIVHLIASMVVVVVGIIQHSVDLAMGNDQPVITITRDAAPDVVLGLANWTFAAQGFGVARPTDVFFGGDPTGIAGQITWTSWGGPVAEGNATAVNEADSVDGTVAGAPQEPAHIVAWDIGTCGGKPAYRKVSWYFAGQHWSPTDYSYDICHPM